MFWSHIQMASSCKRSRTPRAKKCFLDRLSALPDDVLHRVLSSVDFLDVVRTSALSRRWRHFWTTMPYLNFNMGWFVEHYDDKRYPFTDPSIIFWDFIKWALLLRGDSQIIRIQLYCENTATHQVNGLLRIAAKQKIQEFCFHDGDFTAHELEIPRVLCETLTVLDLCFRDSVPLRAMSVFINLRSLSLRGVQISGDAAEKLLSSDCIKLENVHIEDCQVENNVELINISACNLKTLTIVNVCTWDKFWVICSFDSKLKICAPNLLSFCYVGPMLRGFELVDTVSLKHVVIRLMRGGWGYMNRLRNHLFCPGTFIGFNHAKALTLSTLVVKYFSPAYNEFVWDSFMLDTLNRLELELRYNATYIEGLINLLKSSPNLESLSIRFKEIPWARRRTRKAIESRSPWKSEREDIACLLYHVKTIRIFNLDGSEFGLELVKFLLQNGKVLERMEIRHTSRANKHQCLNKIVALPKASSQVVFCFPEEAPRKLPWFDRGDSDPEYDD